MTIACLPLPAGFQSVSATVDRPKMGNGGYLVRVRLVDESDPPNHATGLISRPLPGLPGGAPKPINGYAFGLEENADAGKQIRHGGKSWLIIPNRFAMSLTQTGDARIDARLTWDVDGQPRDITGSVESLRSDYRKLALACWNGDFGLSNIQFETRSK